MNCIGRAVWRWWELRRWYCVGAGLIFGGLDGFMSKMHVGMVILASLVFGRIWHQCRFLNELLLDMGG